jgi:sec-independent protein translocase protein TatB
MFDVSWQELLVVGIVALIVVGPKELPTLLRTVGKYVGAIKRQASEFRAQFDEAMRESELEQIRKDVEKIKTDTESSLRDVGHSVDAEMSGARREIGDAANSIGGGTTHADQRDANGLLFPDEVTAHPPVVNAGSAAIAAAAAAAPPADTSDARASPEQTPPEQPTNDQTPAHPTSANPPPSSPPNTSGTSPAKADA